VEFVSNVYEEDSGAFRQNSGKTVLNRWAFGVRMPSYGDPAFMSGPMPLTVENRCSNAGFIV
jgi:hypothetical protein